MRIPSFALPITLFYMLSSLAAANTPQEQTIRKKNVPAAVLSAFEQAYPRATMKGFARETSDGNTVYEVESIEGSVHRDVLYNPDGTIVSIEESLPFASLPQGVRDAIEKAIPKGKVTQCEKLIKGSTTQFEVIMKLRKETYEVVLEAGGNIVTKEKK